MADWRDRIEEYRKVSLNKDFLDSRRKAEDTARELLNEKVGSFTRNDLKRFLSLCNTERVPPNIHSIELKPIDSNSRFQRSFKGQNANLIIDCINEFNKWIPDLWNATSTKETMKVLDNIWKTNTIKGAGTGFPSMIMYLKDSDIFNVWISYLDDAIVAITNKSLEEKAHGIEWRLLYYLTYNQSVNKYFSGDDSFSPRIEPQERDYILFRVSINLKYKG
jgi:hypothetical protein